MKRYSNRKNNIRNKGKISYKFEQNMQNENFDDKNEFFIFEPMTNASSEKNRNAENAHNECDECKTINKNSDNIINNDIITDSNNDNTKKENILDTVNKFIDKILNDDFLIIALIVIIFYERNKLKNAGTDKNILNDYDMMIAALIYLFI